MTDEAVERASELAAPAIEAIASLVQRLREAEEDARMAHAYADKQWQEHQLQTAIDSLRGQVKQLRERAEKAEEARKKDVLDLLASGDDARADNERLRFGLQAGIGCIVRGESVTALSEMRQALGEEAT